VLITADHGEEFMEHGVAQHGRSLYDDVLHVPVVVKLPRGRSAGARVADVASALDLAPTLLDYAGIPVPASFVGSSLRPLTEGAQAPPRALFAEQLGPGHSLYAVRAGRWKYVRRLLPEPEELLFDLARDPEESVNLMPGQAVPAPVATALAEFIDLGLSGYHVRFDSSPHARQVRIEADGGFKEVIRLVARTGDRLDFAPGARRFEYTIAPGGPPRRLVLRTERDGEAVRVSGQARIWYVAPRENEIVPDRRMSQVLRALGYLQ
jgi:hypothetical protein